jgi:carboxyl-terminal processing protease
MKNFNKYLVKIAAFLLLIAVLVNCKKEITQEITPVPIVIKEATDVNKFIYNGLKDYYLWVDKVPNFNNAKFLIKDSLNAFLNTYTDPNKLFTDLLYQYKSVDKWSFIVDDSKIIENWIQGISETMGYDFMLGRIGTTDNVFGFVRYVYKGSPAEKAGIKRGNFFMKVDDQQLTVTNYQTLLYTKVTYKLSMASISGNVISLNGIAPTMTAITMQENPIQLDTILNVNNLKIGYLVYNEFNAAFDLQLNEVFKKFKDAGIDKLVLDLRYNGGGSVQTAKYLASMIYGTSSSKILIKNQYNPDIQAYFISTYGLTSLNEYFTDKITVTSTTSVPINTLNLSKLYVLTSNNSASASELLINGLIPYMQMVNIGINTAGKYVASITVKDWDVNGVVNPNHKWAMQPIIVKYSNSMGVTDFSNGLTPNITLEEDFRNLLPFGDQNETLLKAALNDIKGLPAIGITLKSGESGLNKVYDSQDHRPFAKQMYINTIPGIKN